METPHDVHRVVCVDDEPAILSALRRALRGEPYRVATTSRPDLALAWVAEGDVSLIVSDERMPAMPGHALLAEAMRLAPHAARVLLTAHPGDALEAEAVDLLIAKPWDDRTFKRAIRRLLVRVELAERPA